VNTADAWIPVYRATRKRDARHRALVLQATGIAHTLVRQPDGFALLVPVSEEARAREELEGYEAENRSWPPPSELPQLFGDALVGSIAYGLLVILFFVAQSRGLFGLDWTASGLSDADRILGGEVWRAVTSLLLHADVMHAGSNVLFGVVFGLLVAQLHGPGLSWLVILLAGVLGNLTNAAVYGSEHLSLGASTAVFGAIGVLVGSEWRRRKVTRQSLTRRLATPFFGVCLYAMLGVGDGTGRTDILAHLFGFLAGIPLGILLCAVPRPQMERGAVQAAAGVAALVVIGVAWTLAFRFAAP
jgi:membrane associated rhomboid family serine protease